MNRRDFMTTTAAASLAAAARPLAADSAPAVRRAPRARPVVISSNNGFTRLNGGDKSCVQTAYERIVGGEDVLDALIAGVNIVELDPADSSVGYGGMPNADGVVQLDSCCMHGPTKRAGGVACIEGVKTPSNVAKAVLEHTDNHLIVGRDATEFARKLGFEIVDDLNTPRSRAAWLEWKKRTDPIHYIRDEAERAARERQVMLDMVAEGIVDENHIYGTINCNGVNAAGEVSGVTTTSGLAWKIPGRVGDSPILGAGLYVDGEVGAAGSTGRGEANLYGLCSFVVVEEMRRGRSPKDAGMEALRRVQANTIAPRLLNDRGLPNFNLNFYVLSKTGEHAGVALYGRAGYAVCDENGPRSERCEPLLEGASGDA